MKPKVNKEREIIDRAWAAEAESRIDAYNSEKIQARPLADVMSEDQSIFKAMVEGKTGRLISRATIMRTLGK